MDKQAHVETGPGQSSDIKQQVQTVRVGINVRFNPFGPGWGMPVR